MATPEESSPSPLLREVDKGATFESWRGTTGAMRLDWSRQGVVRQIIIGQGQVEFGPIVVRRWDMAIRPTGRITLLLDYWDMPTYDSGLRVHQTGWALKYRPQLDGLHMVSRSRLVSMGIAVVNLALGGIVTSHTQRSTFDALVKNSGFPVNPTIPE